MELLIIWIAISAIVGIIGADRKIGLLKAFGLSLLFSPIVGFVLTMASESKEKFDGELFAIKSQLFKNRLNQMRRLTARKMSKLKISPEAELKAFKAVKMDRLRSKFNLRNFEISLSQNEIKMPYA